MRTRKILLKTQSGRPVCTLTIGGEPSLLTLPNGVTPLAVLTKTISFLPQSPICLSNEAEEISVLAEKEGEILFATTLRNMAATEAKWRLFCAWEQRITPPTAPIKEDDPTDEKAPEPAEEDAQTTTPFEVTEVLPAQTETALSRAEKLLQSGTPFPLFEKLMPSSRWALIQEESAPYLVGIKEQDGIPHVLYGVPGARDYPPDEGTLWSFFPIGEDGETGYFLTEAKESPAGLSEELEIRDN